MPESVKDRCTRSHEYIFLLSKSPKYYFDSKAIQEIATYPTADGIKFGGSKYGDNLDNKFAIYSGNEYSSTGVRNKRDVWSVIPAHYKEAHFATFPEELIRPMILAGCPKDGIVLDPFMGSGTTAVVAKLNRRNYIGTELNPEYIKMAENRINNTSVAIELFDIDSLDRRNSDCE
jgi:site-specific DNA-methyltransferase (adenine-specific)